MKTAMQRFREELDKANKYIHDFPGEYYEGQRTIYSSLIEVIDDEFMPEEKEQIVNAHMAGDFKMEITDAETYYSKTYTKPLNNDQ